MVCRPPFWGHFGSFWVILGPFGPFLTLLGHLGGGNGSKWVRTPYSWGKMGWGVRIDGPLGRKCRLELLFGAIFGHFEPFWTLLTLF